MGSIYCAEKQVTWIPGKWLKENPWEEACQFMEGLFMLCPTWEIKTHSGCPLVLPSITLEAIKQLRSVFSTTVNVKDKGQRVISSWPGRAHKRRKFQWNSVTLTILKVCMCVKQHVCISNKSLFLLEYYTAGHKLKRPHGQAVPQTSEAGWNRWM